ncbi:MAG: type I-E CRISPR-associated protein Cse2/CasB [Acidimicrobiia bacterium]
MSEAAIASTGRRYWDRYADGEGGWRDPSRTPPGDELAALRRGAGRPPWTVPSMWPFLTEDVDDRFRGPDGDRKELPPGVIAEHHALVLFAIHQQSQRRPVHMRGVGLGTAVRALHGSNRFTKQAVDRRFYSAVTADELGELVHHLRHIIRLLHGLPNVVALDYGRLMSDIRDWRWPGGRDRVRRRWGLQYHSFHAGGEGSPALTDSTPDTP